MYLGHRTRIEAPASAIWAVLCDLRRWGEWNLLTAHCPTELGPGARLDLRIRLVGGRMIPARARIVAYRPERELRWKGGIPGLFRAIHGFDLIPIDDEVTDVVHDEVFSGIFVRPLLRLSGKDPADRYREVNENLRLRV